MENCGLTWVIGVELLNDVSEIPPRPERTCTDYKGATIYVKKLVISYNTMMTRIKLGKQQKFAYRIFACIISCHHYYVMISDIVMMT